MKSEIPKSLYRFRSLSELLYKELKYREIYLASSQELNDPWDLNPFFDLALIQYFDSLNIINDNAWKVRAEPIGPIGKEMAFEQGQIWFPNLTDSKHPNNPGQAYQ